MFLNNIPNNIKIICVYSTLYVIILFFIINNNNKK